jgi:hypothetical protein
MGLATWNVVFVHPDENFKAVDLYEHAKKLFERIGRPSIVSSDECGTYATFDPIDTEVPISERDGDERGHAPFYMFIYYSPRSVAGEQDGMPRTFEVGYTFDSPPDLIKENDQTIETKLRANMKGIVEELEQVTGSRFVFRNYVGE